MPSTSRRGRRGAFRHSDAGRRHSPSLRPTSEIAGLRVRAIVVPRTETCPTARARKIRIRPPLWADTIAKGVSRLRLKADDPPEIVGFQLLSLGPGGGRSLERTRLCASSLLSRENTGNFIKWRHRRAGACSVNTWDYP